MVVLQDICKNAIGISWLWHKSVLELSEKEFALDMGEERQCDGSYDSIRIDLGNRAFGGKKIHHTMIKTLEITHVHCGWMMP